jgi:hypothetical protein
VPKQGTEFPLSLNFLAVERELINTIEKIDVLLISIKEKNNKKQIRKYKLQLIGWLCQPIYVLLSFLYIFIN